MVEPMPAQATARMAGLLYLITVVTGMFSLMYVPSQINVPGNLSATIANIVASPSLYRLGIAAGLVCYTVFLMVPLLLYRLLSPVNRNAAALMVLFAVVNVPIALLSIAAKLDILSLLDGAGHPPAVLSDLVQAQVQHAINAYHNGMLIGEIFAGLWLIPFGYLAFKSGFLPRVLGIVLIAGGFGYLVTVFGHVLLPDYDQLPIANFDTLPAGLGEIGMCLWLILFGVRPQKRAASSPP
jgi:hypothetical protein